MKILCPICQKELFHQEKDWYCEQNHHFDQAKEGYLHLLPGQKKDHGDEEAMVKARTQFLESGHYSFLRDRLSTLIEHYPHDQLVDFGCGEGYYTKAFPAKEKIGIDAAKSAIKHASKKDKSTQYIVASFFQELLEEQSQDIVVTCFAPIADVQIERVLKKGGVFIVVTPAPKHLWDLKEVLYETPYLNPKKDLDLQLSLVHQEILEKTLTLSKSEIESLFQMTPYYHHTPEEGRKKLGKLDQLCVLASFEIRVYQK